MIAVYGSWSFCVETLDHDAAICDGCHVGFQGEGSSVLFIVLSLL